ncbi:hypothetical protein P153DRAFT_369081 [Dothidotthia symphoricarpi CBS 119687]|uniref:Uncharacterized protein n=1 Tax=Dothidotthia symphoricarpi CBS 119687 TaxID=1392245 RepID=A0A6A6A5H4_9PLEO|nr:uncharacterized protein P153DRAFT_369081 [Dothidotthia symphoricarpi CBS 119687]KAF2126364.1 hypothetical protein P153DRAFT_369081 [Dothidotthia symphoricarpi CBS 119687]
MAPRISNQSISHNFPATKPIIHISTTEIPQYPLPNSTEVLDPTLITQDFDLLRFEAAAFGQLPAIHSGTASPADSSQTSPVSPRSPASPADAKYSTNLISSPYNNPGHYLDLTTLPPPSLLFAKALTALKPVRGDYATAPYTEALNFDDVLNVLRELLRTERDGVGQWAETSFYVVTFRSLLNEGVDQEWLYRLDYESHREACESGGLLKYWFGKSGGDRRNLATCFWHSREDAYKGGLGPWHKKARAAGRELYEKIVFSTHRFTVLEGVQGYRFEDWRE